MDRVCKWRASENPVRLKGTDLVSQINRKTAQGQEGIGMFKYKTAALLAASMLMALPVVPAFSAEEPVAKAAAETQSFPAIRVVSATDRMLTDRIIVTGTVEAVEEVYVQPQVEGLRIETLKADVGDTVQAGDTLATLSEDALILQKSQLQANRAKTEGAAGRSQGQ